MYQRRSNLEVGTGVHDTTIHECGFVADQAQLSAQQLGMTFVASIFFLLSTDYMR